MIQKPFLMALLACLASLANPALAQVRVQTDASRGELLYATHCITCHSAQLHWRDNQLAQDWPSLKAEVRRWQGASWLGWSEDDVTEVATYLNTRFYRFPAPAAGRASAMKQVR